MATKDDKEERQLSSEDTRIENEEAGYRTEGQTIFRNDEKRTPDLYTHPRLLKDLLDGPSLHTHITPNLLAVGLNHPTREGCLFSPRTGRESVLAGPIEEEVLVRAE